MRTEIIKINLGQKLGHIMSFIPTDTIFNKKIPGLGATYLELICKRCSIVIVPNKPVIKGKVKQFKEELNIDILGVYHGISDERIIKYITSSVRYKKIITTPESYILRIKPLMELYKIDFINDYFMLYDESERTIQDNDYRDTITAPMVDFFDFKERAMVTATPINPSDPRFEKHGFYHLEVEPTFDYTKKIHLLTTNNVLLSTREYLKNIETDGFCIFLNSTDGILSIIRFLKIEAESQIFCSDKSVKKLRKEGFKNAYSDLQPLMKYNFFTSSFFSAVDIELTFKPDVVILTDLFFAEQSIIDPATEAVQIVGRFRQGFNSLTHISNVNPNIKYQTREEIKKHLADSQKAYSTLNLLFNTHTGSEKEVFQQALESVAYSKYVDDNGETNWFKIDNKLDEDMVKSYYSSVDSLRNAYKNVDHFKITHSEAKYPLSDEHRLKRTKPKDDVDLFKMVVEQLDVLKRTRNDFTIDNSMEFFNQLNEEHPEICKLYNELGRETIEKHGYKISRTRKLIKKKLAASNQYPFPAIREILQAFNHRLLTDVPCSELETVINKIKVKYNLHEKASTILKAVYSVSERKQLSIKGQRVWCRQLSNPKFELPN